MTIRIGITGPIGCGKSTIAAWLGELGARVIDADAVARDVTALGEPSLAVVLARFGDAYRKPDGSLNRAALGRLVFSDPAALEELEAIVHPAVRSRIEEATRDAVGERAPAVVIEAIKLVEGGLAAECDEVWLVTCDPTSQRQRLVGRGSTPDDASQRMTAQADLADRLLPSATRVIDTSKEIADTRRQVLEAWAASGAG